MTLKTVDLSLVAQENFNGKNPNLIEITSTFGLFSCAYTSTKAYFHHQVHATYMQTGNELRAAFCYSEYLACILFTFEIPGGFMIWL